MGYKAVRTERYKYIDYLELDGMNAQRALDVFHFVLAEEASRELIPGMFPTGFTGH